jgi:uncharacterized protein YggL (DUF469 family)
MRQTELLNIQEAISFEGYDRWITLNRDEEDSHRPAYRYIRDICEENGYEPTGSDMSELEGELMFCIEQYSKLLYAYYRDAVVSTMEEADAVSIMATMQEDMNNDLIVF